ncbi:hypothetical protein NLI96_g2310 [Meripilus lineatus]|uniref:Dienelactone hydrolase domain-containing protein n=1 Tax=Meripilus lineatus TaxID=2056292 RepID=A0AAD5V911_9APHY|nr:hypothetical protein NLI96_g2310 [Physisporinus lineatus]
MSLCKHCISGVRHEGTPAGKFEEVGGIRTYVATPTVDYPKDKVLLYLTDIFGPDLLNHQLLADDFAINGFKVYVPDLFNGDACPADSLEPGSSFDLMAWIGKHGADTTAPIFDAVIGALKTQGITRIGTTGYCYGGRGCFDLAIANRTNVTVVAHPSLLRVPEDLEAYEAKSQAPLLINSCQIDSQFPITAQEIADKLLTGFGPGYKRTYSAGCTHGFAVRGDLSDPVVKAGKENVFKATVEFLIEHL